MEELNGRMIACQILITGLIARVANDSKDPLKFLTDFRDEILAVVRQVRIAGALEPKGVLTIDAGAAAALGRGKSLLPAGVIRVDGKFGRGDAVIIRGPDGAEIARGLVAYDAEDAAKIVRKSSADIMLILGVAGRAEMVHRDDMVLGGA